LAALRTRSRVASEMRGLSRNASETLDLSMPNTRAKSAMVTRFFIGSSRGTVDTLGARRDEVRSES
jgi:hypothetical protein